MENLKIYIKSSDIKKYMLLNSDKLKYKEALFLRYLDDTDKNTKEKYEMINIDACGRDLFSFDKYLYIISENHIIQTADIALMLVPALGLNSLFTGDINIDSSSICNFASLLDYNAGMEKVIKEAIERLRFYSKEYANSKNEIDYPIKEIGIFNDILGMYVKLRNYGIIAFNGSDFSLIGKNRCMEELDSYSNIYGAEPVEIIKEYAKELKEGHI